MMYLLQQESGYLGEFRSTSVEGRHLGFAGMRERHRQNASESHPERATLPQKYGAGSGAVIFVSGQAIGRVGGSVATALLTKYKMVVGDARFTATPSAATGLAVAECGYWCDS